jgi:uncharacterized membrane protein HdeD (DUF308 family)
MHPLSSLVRAHPLKPSIFLPTLMIIFGWLAIILPVTASIGFARLVGWLMLLGGVVQVIHAFKLRGVGHVLWSLLIALLYVVTSVYLLAHPILAVAVLTLVLSAFFFTQGLVDVIAYFLTRTSGGSPWMLLSGIVTILMAVVIWRHWLASSLRVVGTFVGISLLLAGTTQLMMALALRKLTEEPGDETPTRDRAT